MHLGGITANRYSFLDDLVTLKEDKKESTIKLNKLSWIDIKMKQYGNSDMWLWDQVDSFIYWRNCKQVNAVRCVTF